jgi:hypothetical protein
MNRQEKRILFERVVTSQDVLKHVNFPLGIVELNGQFHHYTDSDTDSAFIGFCLGMTCAGVK